MDNRGLPGQSKSVEHRAKISKTISIYLQTEVGHAQAVAGGKANTGIRRTDEAKARYSAAAKKRWENPEYRQKMLPHLRAAARKLWDSPASNTAGSLAALRAHHLKETKIERVVRETFELANVRFIQHHRIDRLTVDFYLPDLNLVVECDGDYWHGRPEQQEIDRRRDKYLRAVGYKVVRWSEHRINEGVDTLMESII